MLWLGKGSSDRRMVSGTKDSQHRFAQRMWGVRSVRFVVFWSVRTACFVALLGSGSAVSPSKPVQVGVAPDLSEANRLPAPFDLTHG